MRNTWNRAAGPEESQKQAEGEDVIDMTGVSLKRRSH